MKKKEKTQVTNTENERGIITIKSMDSKMIIKEHYEQICVHKFDN